jgi:tRNA (cytidine/uridine-2'-O-)-methyltransferase
MPCGSHFTSPTSRKTPEPFCACAHASVLKRTSSNRRGRAGLDYLDAVTMTRHRSWRDFESWRHSQHCRLLLFTTSGALPYLDFAYRADDVLLFGRESAGVPADVHAVADARLLIPTRKGLRSLNVAAAAAMAVGEALRQTKHGIE